MAVQRIGDVHHFPIAALAE